MRGLHKKLSSSVEHQVVSAPFIGEDGSSLTSSVGHAMLPHLSPSTPVQGIFHTRKETLEVLQGCPQNKPKSTTTKKEKKNQKSKKATT